MPLDAAIAAEEAEFLTFPDLLKAIPAEEGGERFVYLEASNEARDYQGEVVLAKALAASADYYRQFGNIDLDHITQVGPRQGIKNYAAFEIGRPIHVNVERGRTFVKGAIYSGDAPVAQQANLFWDSLTKLNPPQRWYPSVGGSVLEKSAAFDPATNSRSIVISGVRWANIGFSKTPVNLTVPAVSTVPLAALMKSLCAGGFDLTKALEAGYGTDAATLTGGAALRTQSLEPRVQSYWDFRNQMAGAVRRRTVTASVNALVAYARDELGLTPHQAAEWTERFLADLKAGPSPKTRSDS